MDISGKKLYLRQNVLVEPLFNQWYAWSYLINPATAAMYIANSHLKIMQSFVANPQIHLAALRNPAMIGGPFINHDASRVPEIKALMERTTKEQAHMVNFAAAVKTLDQLLLNEAQGYSLEPIYPKVPDILRGYVELVYDLNGNPSYRFIEGLLYRSPYYQPSSQSLALSLVEKDDRPFIFSTPRLSGAGHLFLGLPFNHEGLDELFKMKAVPQTFGYIKEILQIRDEDEESFSAFFTEESPPPPVVYSDGAVRIRYFGHACLVIESKGACVLTDPVISYAYHSEVSRYTYVDLPEVIDYVLLTHNHQDHLMFETLLQLRHKIKTIIVPKNNGGGLADPSLKFILQMLGFDSVREIDELEAIQFDGGLITGLPFLGEHADLNIRTKLAYLLNLKGRSILCAADSNNIEPRLYEHLHKLIGDVDVVFVGMECEGAPLSWLYGPLLTKPLARKMEQSRRLDGSNCIKGIDLIDKLRPKQVYVYAMGQEPWLTYLTSIHYTKESLPIVESDQLIEDCRSRGVVAERLYCQKELFL